MQASCPHSQSHVAYRIRTHVPPPTCAPHKPARRLPPPPLLPADRNCHPTCFWCVLRLQYYSTIKCIATCMLCLARSLLLMTCRPPLPRHVKEPLHASTRPKPKAPPRPPGLSTSLPVRTQSPTHATPFRPRPTPIRFMWCTQLVLVYNNTLYWLETPEGPATREVPRTASPYVSHGVVSWRWRRLRRVALAGCLMYVSRGGELRCWRDSCRAVMLRPQLFTHALVTLLKHTTVSVRQPLATNFANPRSATRRFTEAMAAHVPHQGSGPAAAPATQRAVHLQHL